MNERINRILEFLDKCLTIEKVEIDSYGRYGAHYDGLMLDVYFNSSILSIDYLDIEDYFLTTINYNYKDYISFYSENVDKEISFKIKLIQQILNILNLSTHDSESGKNIVKKVERILEQLGVTIQYEGDNLILCHEYIKFRGSYSDIIELNSTTYKKRLNDKYKNQTQWQIRIKREFDNMMKLKDSNYILKVYSYDEIEHSYLMEVCECDLADYLETNMNISEEELLEIIYDILCGMQDAHTNAIIHRDLHLGNFLRKDGHFVISDFGLSKDTFLISDYKSSSTPKNSHMFMEPIGKSDFAKLDKLSDIYSIGKIIEYITYGTQLNKDLSLIISKCTDRNRNNRYQDISEIITSIEQTLDAVTKVEDINVIKTKIKNYEFDSRVEVFISKQLENRTLADFIVQNVLMGFTNIIIKCSDTMKRDIWENISENYVDATGYGGFANYDTFAEIAMDYIYCEEENIILRKKAMSVLKGCSQYRFKAYDYYIKAKADYSELI